MVFGMWCSTDRCLSVGLHSITSQKTVIIIFSSLPVILCISFRQYSSNQISSLSVILRLHFHYPSALAKVPMAFSGYFDKKKSLAGHNNR